MLRAIAFHWLLLDALRTGWFLPDVAILHALLLLCAVQHSFLRLSVARLGDSRAAVAFRFSFEVYRRLYELFHAGCGAAAGLAERWEPVRECADHYRAEKARFVAALVPRSDSRAMLYLKGSYLSAQLAKDCVAFHQLDPEQTAQLLTRACAFVKALALLVRASAVPQRLAAEQAADAEILRSLRDLDDEQPPASSAPPVPTPQTNTA